MDTTYDPDDLVVMRSEKGWWIAETCTNIVAGPFDSEEVAMDWQDEHFAKWRRKHNI